MDIQLQELIEKIKKDGVESASQDAERIKAVAQEDAKRIESAARKEAGEIIEKAKIDAERSEKAGIAAVEQASRNLVLAFKDEIQHLLDKIVSKEISEAFKADALKAILPELVKGLSAGKAVDIILNAKDLSSLDSWAKGALSAELAKGTELKPGKIDAGFRIAEKDGSAYYDFSAEAVAQALSAYLNPRLAEALKSAARGQ